MKENYTKNAQEAIRLAKSASRHNKQNYTGTEHLLLGLIAEPDGVASKVLRDNNCTLERLNDMIAQLNIRSANLRAFRRAVRRSCALPAIWRSSITLSR